MIEEPRVRFVVKNKTAEAPGVCTLHLSQEDGTLPRYESGQFITVYFPELGTPEGKAYSISSAPGESTLDITVKEMGEFSRRLGALTPGDIVEASVPNGFFFSESKESTLVMVAGGIGVAPFRGMLLDSIQKNPQRKLMLHYSSRTAEDVIFKKLFDEMQATNGALHVMHYLTREKEVPSNMVRGRIDARTLAEGLQNTPDPEFLICGSIAFVRDLWRGLRDAGIPEEALYTEAFFSH